MSDKRFDRAKSKKFFLINYISTNFRLRNLENVALEDINYIFSMNFCFEKFVGYKGLCWMDSIE